MAHRSRWFSQLENSIDKGFSIAMLNNQMVPFKYSYPVCCWYNRFAIPNTTVDGQNIHTLGNHRMLNPHTPNFNVSGRMFAKVTLGVWFLSSTGAHAPQATLTLNFGGKGVVLDSKGLNISSIYCSQWHVWTHQLLSEADWDFWEHERYEQLLRSYPVNVVWYVTQVLGLLT